MHQIFTLIRKSTKYLASNHSKHMSNTQPSTASDALKGSKQPHNASQSSVSPTISVVSPKSPQKSEKLQHSSPNSTQQAEKSNEKSSQKSQKASNSSPRNTFIAKVDALQLHLSFAVLATLVFLYYYPPTHQYGKRFFELSGQVSANTYKKGPDDFFFIATAVLSIIFVRIFCMDLVFKPICSSVLGLKSEGTKQRFAEQSWAFVSYTSSFLWGFKLYFNSEYFNNLDNLYLGYPHYMTKELKAYYLIELANWTSQLFIIHIEKRRKDHYQMLAHHIITIALVYLSLLHNFTRVGNVIQTLMDFVDIWLALAKILRYCGFQNLCDFTFLIFFFSWVLLRHGLYNYLLYFTSSKLLLLANLPECAGATGNCLDAKLVDYFLYLLTALQAIMCLWMYLILRVLYKIIMGSGADDVRSDSEEED